MASKNIKGITIEIGGNTTKLQDALKGVNKTIYSTNSELKQLNQALKLDPKNTELLAQKQELLKKNIEATSQKLNQLKDAQKQMGDYSKLTDEQKEAYRGLSVEIAKTEGYLKNMNQELKNTNSIDLSKLGSGLKKVGDIAADVLKKVAQVSAAVGTALAGVVAAGVKSYAEYEQQLGGIEAMFDKTTEQGRKGFEEITKTGKNAWKDLTMSTTDYYKSFTSTYTLVKNSIPDQQKAIETTNRMIQLESDLSNTFGYDIEQASNAINWALKGSFNYIDNLNLGIKGTKEGFLEAAHECGYLVGSVDELTSDQILNVLEQYADKFGVMGRTANEASGTIQGSVKSMKAAFDNFLNGSGGAQELAETVTNVLRNVGSAIQKLVPDIMAGITSLLQEIVPQISEILITMLPQLLEAVQNLISSLLTFISENVEPIAQMVTSLLTSLVNFVIQNLPLILETGIKILLELIKGIAQALPQLIPTITKVILDMVDILINNIDLIIDAGIELMMGLLEGIINALPEILERLPEIIIKITMALLNMKMKLLEAGITLIVELAKGLIKAIPQLVKQIPQIISSMVNALKDGLSKFSDIGKNIVKGIWSGISGSLSWIKDKLTGWVGNVTKFIKKIFGINSPSRLMRDEIGVYLAEGIGVGFEKGMPSVLDDVNNAMSQLNAGVQASVNPTINPTANSNPLIIQIENFNNQRNTDIQALAEELEYYRKNSSLAVGGN